VARPSWYLADLLILIAIDKPNFATCYATLRYLLCHGLPTCYATPPTRSLRHVFLPAVPRLPTRYATGGYPLCHAFLPATPRVKGHVPTCYATHSWGRGNTWTLSSSSMVQDPIAPISTKSLRAFLSCWRNLNNSLQVDRLIWQIVSVLRG